MKTSVSLVLTEISNKINFSLCIFLEFITGIPGSCELILAGKRYFPFEFELPEACPCSFVGSRGSIEYRLRVYLLLSNGEQLCADKGLKVLRKTIINKMMV